MTNNFFSTLSPTHLRFGDFGMTTFLETTILIFVISFRFRTRSTAGGSKHLRQQLSFEPSVQLHNRPGLNAGLDRNQTKTHSLNF